MEEHKDVFSDFEMNAKGKSVAFFAKNENALVSKEMIEKLKEIGEKNGKNTVRICMQRNPEENLQDMIILAYKNKLCKKPHKHLNSNEAVMMIEGSMLALIFDDSGNLIRKFVLDSEKSPIFRNNQGINHVFIPISEHIIYRETIGGKFEPAAMMDNHAEAVGKHAEKEIYDCKNENCKNPCGLRGK